MYSNGNKVGEDLASYLAAAVINASPDTGRGVSVGNVWLKNTSVEARVKKEREESISHTTDLTESSSNELTTDLEGYMNEIDHWGGETGRKSNKLDDSSSISSQQEDYYSEYKAVHGRVLTMDDLKDISQLVSPSPTRLSSSSYVSSSHDEGFNPMGNVHTIEELGVCDLPAEDDSVNLHMGVAHGQLDKSIESDDTEISRGNLMSNVHMIGELEDTELIDSSQSLSQDHSSNGAHMGQSHSEEHNDGYSKMKEGESGESTSSETVDEREYQYSMEYDSDVSEEVEDEEKEDSVGVETGAETARLSSHGPRQIDHLKEQSCQTNDVLIMDREDAPPTHNYLHSTPLLPYTVVSEEELEVLSAYSPATVALQDLVRSQVELTRHLIDQSRALSQHLADSATPSYQYVTLSQTKESTAFTIVLVSVALLFYYQTIISVGNYIASHKPRVLSYQEALRQVRRNDDHPYSQHRTRS